MSSKRFTRESTNVFLIGAAVANLRSRKLPTTRQVMQLFFYQHKVLKKTIRQSAHIAVKKCIIFWSKTNIRIREEKHLVEKLENLFNKWKHIQKAKSRSSSSATQASKEFAFEELLNALFDIAHQDALAMADCEDKKFLISQRQKQRFGTFAVIIDTAEEEKGELETNENHNFRYIRNNDEILSDPNNYGFSENEEEFQCIGLSDSDEDFNASSLISAETLETSDQVQKSTKINLFTSEVSATADRLKLSHRATTRILAAVAGSLGNKVENAIFDFPCKETVRVCREKERENFTSGIQEVFEKSLTSCKTLAIGWDGKLLPDPNQKRRNVDRMPVLVSGVNINQLLGVPKLNNSSAEAQANAIIKLLQEWNIENKISCLCFDTTATNTGLMNGACKRLENYLGRTLLHLACRHHIYELGLRAAFEECFGATSGPDVLLFKRFQTVWTDLDQKNFESGINNPDVFELLRNEKGQCLQFAIEQLEIQKKSKHSRSDYKEFLELVIIFLGSEPSGGISFKAPGAVHHARWMAKVLYCLKIYMFRGQFHLTRREEVGMQKMCIFIVLIYQKAWFKVGIPTEAPRIDLETLQSLKKCTLVDNQIREAVLKKLLGHLWYLSELLIGLSFFDENVSVECKREMVRAIKECLTTAEPLKRITIDQTKIESFTLDQFVTTKTMLFFEKLHIVTDFLNSDPETWKDREDFKEGLQIVQALPVTNDNAERGVALMSKYNTLITKCAGQEQLLLQVVKMHREVFPGYDKKTLKQSFEDFIFRRD